MEMKRVSGKRVVSNIFFFDFCEVPNKK